MPFRSALRRKAQIIKNKKKPKQTAVKTAVKIAKAAVRAVAAVARRRNLNHNHNNPARRKRATKMIQTKIRKCCHLTLKMNRFFDVLQQSCCTDNWTWFWSSFFWSSTTVATTTTTTIKEIRTLAASSFLKEFPWFGDAFHKCSPTVKTF